METQNVTGDLTGQRALVTGATRGIGRAIALELAAAGAVVVGTATTDEGAAKISACLKEGGYAGTGMTLDVKDDARIAQVLQAFEKVCGGMPTILVNNAGITRDNLLMRMKDEEWDAIMDTNLKAIFRLSRAIVPAMMKARFGRIIQIGSVVGSMGNAGQTNYAAAKAALIGFSKALAQEVGSRGVTVNCVAPGFINTDMTQSLSELHKEALLKSVAVKRLGKAEDIAHAVGFLASPRASYVTGVTLHVNGGMYMA